MPYQLMSTVSSQHYVLGCAATSSRLFPARTKLLFAITQQLHKEGVLYTLPPCQDGSVPAPSLQYTGQ